MKSPVLVCVFNNKVTENALLKELNMVLFFLNANHPSTLLACLFIDFIGVVIAVIFAALSHLVLKAADLQEQSDYTV